MDSVACDHCEAQVIGETEGFDEHDLYGQYEICLCGECGEQFTFPLAA